MIFFCVFLIFPVGLTCLLNFKNILTKKFKKRKNPEFIDEEENNNLVSTYDTGFVDFHGSGSGTSVPFSDEEKK
jgi:hypothetical protein